ncbi:GntR family transcriptional regulator [Corynebacterium sp. LK2510]|uniref:GntR family transcriptional regulator n=1 Tax=Corynebacterium sp. LK2510 TaxID=3110472 RepID=UPI0034CDDA4A
MVAITINPDGDLPVFQQIHDAIVVAIARGELRPGDTLDPVRRVAAEFGINPATVQRAYDQLRAEGLIESASRSGSRVAPPSCVPPDLAGLRPILARAAAQGTDAHTLRELIDAELAYLYGEDHHIV